MMFSSNMKKNDFYKTIKVKWVKLGQTGVTCVGHRSRSPRLVNDSVSSCFYMYVRPIPAEGEPEQPREGFGFMSRQVKVQEPPSYSDCVYWSGEEKDFFFDSMWKAGKAMGMLAVGVGFIVMCIVVCTCCVAYQLPTFDGLFWTCMFCFAAQCLSFLSWGSELCDDYECSWAPGSGTSISAAMLWIWAANMIKSFPEALPPRGGGRRGAMYEEDDEYYEDSPYYDPNGFEDEYYGEEEDWQPDQEYYDDGYDDSTYGDGYDDATYDDSTYHGDQGKGHRGQGETDGDTYMQDEYYNDQYSTDDYSAYDDPDMGEGDQRQRQGGNDNFEPDPHFRDTWSSTDNESTFDGNTGGNYFQSDSAEPAGALSQEEMEYLGNQSFTTRSTMEDLD
eukprot:scaffold6130_cov131-Cylindrotheca_fusiformis.AAC.5